MTTVNVGTADFRRALNAVRVHASTDSQVPPLHRIRLAIDRQNIVVTATDTFTAGMAIASVWNSSDGPGHYPCTVDIALSDIKNILQIFTAGKEKSDTPEFELRLDITDNRITITDCSGLIDGHALTVPRMPTDGGTLCTIPGLIARQRDSDATLLTDMSVGGEVMARFSAASNAYGHALDIEAHSASRALLIRCGEDFLGLMMPRQLLDQDRDERREWSAGWDRRLPDIVAAAEAERAEQPRTVNVVDLDATEIGKDREMFLRGVDLVVRSQFGSAAMLQRRMRIGFAKAARLLDLMEQAGIVAPADGSKARDVLVRAEDLDSLLADLRTSEPGNDR
ncbi:DNA translocase FtsK [Nocardia sp. NPDC049220]|uniref:DNA translocase FtsK n=1 Tax=Nocardia sp. NPDC049220 TaxID=3155273 RepID=UPI0033DD84D2